MTYHQDFNYCKNCGAERSDDCPLDYIFQLCPPCLKRRDDAYDDYVDSIHWYHQHGPDRVDEP